MHDMFGIAESDYTGQLQPLDVSFNGPFKSVLRRAMQAWLSNIVASKFVNGAAPSALNLKEEFKLTNLKAPFCAAMDEALRYFTTEKGEKAILRGFKKRRVFWIVLVKGRGHFMRKLWWQMRMVLCFLGARIKTLMR